MQVRGEEVEEVRVDLHVMLMVHECEREFRSSVEGRGGQRG